MVGVIHVVHDILDAVAGEQLSLGIPVVVKSGMFRWTDVIFRQIGVNRSVEGQSADPVVVQSLGRNLENTVSHAGFHHHGEIPVKFPAFRGGVDGFVVLIPDENPVGSDVGTGNAAGAEDFPDEDGGGGLSLGAGQTDQLQLVGGIAVEPCGQMGEGFSGMGNNDLHRVFGKGKLPFHHKCTASRIVQGRREIVTVQTCAGHTEKQGTAGFCLPGVVFHRIDFDTGRITDHTAGISGQQLIQFD